MNAITAIPTEYKGYRFRSRLEARWAVFFDACGVKWEYEPEGFALPNGQFYLPDFLLHGCDGRSPEDLYVEVKGKMTESDAEKIRQFSGISNHGSQGYSQTKLRQQRRDLVRMLRQEFSGFEAHRQLRDSGAYDADSWLGEDKNGTAAAHLREAAALYAHLMERTTTTLSLIFEMAFFHIGIESLYPHPRI